MKSERDKDNFNMKETNDIESAKLVAAYASNPMTFARLYEDTYFPPLSESFMNRLQCGIGSLDEIYYYQHTKQGQQDLIELEFTLPVNSKKDQRNDPSQTSDDVPF